MRGHPRSFDSHPGSREIGCVDLDVARTLLAGASAELGRLAFTRGAHRRTAGRLRRALAALTLATGLLGAPLPGPASASTARFQKAYRGEGLPTVKFARPTLADIDRDGDLDLLVGEWFGETVVSENTGTPFAPAFAPAIKDAFGLADVGNFATPDLVDIDGDGDFDVFVGESYGDTRFFENTGSPATPAFAVAIVNPFGLANVGYQATPKLADIDGDGDYDAFLGNSDGNITFFENTGTPSAPAFTSAIVNPFGLANVGRIIRPDLVDIDGDGDLDIFGGETESYLYFFENTGSSAAPAFAPPSVGAFGIGSFADPTEPGSSLRSVSPAFADIDGDGDFDAFAGDRGGAMAFFANTGSSTAPAFASVPANPFRLTDVGEACSPALADMDGDGDLDALSGAYDGHSRFFENTGSPSTPAFAPAVIDPFGLTDVGADATPALVDIDGDGDFDVFIGEFYGDTHFFENTGSSTAPAFAAPVVNPFRLRNVRYAPRPELVDIDGDGDFDLFIGTYNDPYARGSENFGDIRFLKNVGSPDAPSFARPVVNPFGLDQAGEYLSYAAPRLSDIDGDGDYDAFVGDSYGDTRFFENTGSANAPAFAPAVMNPFGLTNVPENAIPALVDIDHDGDVDVLAGAYDGETHFFENLASNCGDGTLQLSETCDDGNTLDGDCCSATCQYELAGSPCGNDGNACTTGATCDGAGLCGTCSAPLGGVGATCGSFCGGVIQCKQPAPGVCTCGGPTTQ